MIADLPIRLSERSLRGRRFVGGRPKKLGVARSRSRLARHDYRFPVEQKLFDLWVRLSGQAAPGDA